MTTFSLCSEPWIPARRPEGAIEELSLVEVFRQAHLIRDIVGEVPTQTFALTRLLLAILHRSIEESDEPLQYWRELWKADELPAVLVEEYLDAFQERFDLLHPITPFFQVADLHTQKGEVSGLERLIADVPNGQPFFTTRSQRGLARISFAEAARWIVHCQAFDTSGIKSGAVGDDRVKGGKGYPIGTAWAGALGGILIEGVTLKQSLLLNLILATEDGRDTSGPDDLPAWERDPLTPAVEDRAGAGPRGQIDLFTWQSRRLRLAFDDDGVTGVLICNGDVVPQQNQHAREPMTSWRRSEPQEKALGLPLVYMPRTHDPERSMWRGLAALLPQCRRIDAQKTGAAALPALTLEWVGRLREGHAIEPGFVIRTRAIGMAYGSQSSTVAEIIDDALSIHAVLVSEQGRELAAGAVDAVTATEEAVTAVAMLAGNLAVAAGGEAAGDRDRAREQAYFLLDSPYRRWLSDLDESTDISVALHIWYDSVRRILWTLAQELIGAAGPTAWVGRENSLGRHVDTPQADVWFRRALAKALPTTRDTRPTATPETEQ
ncbi:type I-E CRISPR-associated protein Cse1/CasA [Rhodococcus sp. ABRD24]|uniref:type I-E CRISPR-associated protein Cse1/CasA n=1 Tax=Rhodococcus sp. ABRD24 TaxID=2507582 RepID=UPI00103B8CFA|nr:type I-E CRISPR-associated protein Cse1/CasA [Rhodococcus sp. ABRD24]QBJ97291.1 type I-E CRISPR-associated protein Cse1/CasA [Rhodococcus sp. ABRD24]